MFQPVSDVQTLHFLLLPGFSLFGLSSMLAPLRHANRCAQQERYRWHLLAMDAGPITASDGLQLTAELGIDDCDTLDCLIICSGDQPEQYADSRLHSFIRRQVAFGAFLGGQDTGAWLLAQAGALDGYRATLHWEYLATAAAQFPAVTFVPELYVLDRTRFSCSGAMSGLDMMLYLIRRQWGEELSAEVAQVLVYSDPRPENSLQRTGRHPHLTRYNQHLSDALEIMEVNLEEPLSIPEIARYLEISVRELERLFRRYLKNTPQGWYRQLRLNRARRLLRQTDDSITYIAGQCGFRSLAHFSRCYRQQFDCSPSEDR